MARAGERTIGVGERRIVGDARGGEGAGVEVTGWELGSVATACRLPSPPRRAVSPQAAVKAIVKAQNNQATSGLTLVTYSTISGFG